MIELPDVESFAELYKKHRQDGILVQDLKIGKDQMFTVFDKKQLTDFEVIHRQNAAHRLMTEFMLAIMEYPNDRFLIQVISRLELIDYPDLKYTQMQEMPDMFFTTGQKVRLYVRIYVFHDHTQR